MGSLTSKVSKALSSWKNCPARIAMIGLDGAGKTTILYRFKMNETLTTIPTVGFNVETLSPMKGLTLTVWDMGGQDRMRPLWRMYLRGTDGVIFVVDSADLERIQEAKEELMRVLDTPEMRNVPLVVVANKQDLPGAADSSRIAKYLGLHQMVSRRWVIHDACATNGHGIGESMESLAKIVKEFKSKHR
ncbi:ADP-ribosylation factor 3-like [Ruditapes philippinarum]|uniref:ADP-ribosylation factor 3-like n=1 Tax=Ruditapes philippinarum TaxID=129788 RepID=UPI00295C0132|nr:ADP-ribosylation factor 3-like [Ruditapes philippinarum]XP_060588180.1 ADP-ribosylation factor 3-like [Ruditapes philippinarum]XP_060588181.1 ADP-ribosylation factor 3-like [Ruditapes philippinarum]